HQKRIVSSDKRNCHVLTSSPERCRSACKILAWSDCPEECRKEGRVPKVQTDRAGEILHIPQFGFKLNNRLELSGIGSVAIRKHRELKGTIKTLTMKKSHSGKWHAIFTTELEKKAPPRKKRPEVGIDLGIENFAYLSDGSKIDNPRNLRLAEERLSLAQKRMAKKQKRSSNRAKARKAVALAYERLTNKRRDFLHKASRIIVEKNSLIAMEDLNNE